VYLTFFVSHLEGKWDQLFKSDEILMLKLFFTIVVRFCYYTFMKLRIFFYFHIFCILLFCKCDFNFFLHCNFLQVNKNLKFEINMWV